MANTQRDRWRYPNDSTLFAELVAEETVRSRVGSPAYALAKQTKRLGFLANAVMVDPDVLPHLAAALERARAEFPEIGVTECFVFNCPDINAFVCQGRAGTFVGVSNAAMNHLQADDLMFVLGHEFGLAEFGHLELAAGLLVEDPTVGPTLTAKLRSWQRSAEISAVRAGLLLAGSPEAAARALFKVSSGIVAVGVATSPEKFAAQRQRLLDEAIQDGKQSSHHASHPFPPLRMKAILDFWIAHRDPDDDAKLRGVNGSVALMLAMMDPAASDRPLGETMLANHFFWGGLYVAASTGDIGVAERGRLASVAPSGINVDQAARDVVADPEACRRRFVDGFQSRRSKVQRTRGARYPLPAPRHQLGGWLRR